MRAHNNLLRPQRYTSTKKIHVVDDSHKLRDMIRVILKGDGYSDITSFESGSQSLRKITLNRPDLILADWDMPNMNGIELLMQIKNSAELFSIPVIIMSEERTTDKVLYAVEEGADGFLVKPFNHNNLVNSVKRALGKAAVDDETEMKVIEMRRLKLARNYQEAMELGVGILEKGANPRVTLMMCECLYQVEEYDKAIAMIADIEEGHASSEYTNLQGKIHLALGQYSQGIFALEQAVKLNPLNTNRKIDLAEAYIAAGRKEEAEKIINSIMNGAPTDLSLTRIAQIYLDLDEIDKAGQLLTQTVDPIKATIHVFNNYAVALRRANKFEDATDIYLKCLKIDPDSDILHYNIAVLYIKCHKMNEARQSLTSALNLNPDNQHAKELLQQCKS